jgi:hypothetical protein
MLLVNLIRKWQVLKKWERTLADFHIRKLRKMKVGKIFYQN